MVGRFHRLCELDTAEEIERWMILLPEARVFGLRNASV
jgi:hypothetical protein